MSLLSSHVTVTASTHVALHTVFPSGWLKLTVTNASTVIPIFVGPTGVTSTGGMPIFGPGGRDFEIAPGDVLYASSTANTTAYVLRSSLST